MQVSNCIYQGSGREPSHNRVRYCVECGGKAKRRLRYGFAQGVIFLQVV